MIKKYQSPLLFVIFILFSVNTIEIFLINLKMLLVKLWSLLAKFFDVSLNSYLLKYLVLSNKKTYEYVLLRSHNVLDSIKILRLEFWS